MTYLQHTNRTINLFLDSYLQFSLLEPLPQKESSETRHEDFYISFIKKRKANKLVYKKLISMKADSAEKSEVKLNANCESDNCYKPD